MKDVNELTLMGRCGNDPEVRTTAGGTRVAQFSVYTNRSWKKADGSWEEKSEAHRVVAWNKPVNKGPQLADQVAEKLKKGDRVMIKGRVEYRSYEDRQKDAAGKAIVRYVTEIVALDINFIDYRNPQSEDGEDRGAYREENSGGRAKAGVASSQDDFPAALEDQDDDLPF